MHRRREETAQDARRCCAFERVQHVYGKSHILNDATLDVRQARS